MKVQAPQIFSMLNRLADIVDEEGVNAELPDLVKGRFDALDLGIVSDGSKDTKDAQSVMRSAVADHWALQADEIVQNASPGPRPPGPSASPLTAVKEGEDEVPTSDAASDLRAVASSLLDAESASTPFGQMVGLSLVRRGLDALRRSGMTVLEPRFATIAGELQGKLTQEASDALDGLRTDTSQVGVGTGFGSRTENLTFPEFIGWMRAELEVGETLDVFPSATGDAARRAMHQLDTLITNATDSSGVLNREIVAAAVEDIHTIMNTNAGDSRQPKFVDVIPRRFGEVFKKNASRLKFLLHFDQTYAKIPLPAAAPSS